jgi:hypothetical protein
MRRKENLFGRAVSERPYTNKEALREFLDDPAPCALNHAWKTDLFINLERTGILRMEQTTSEKKGPL